jgi:hypothetical protein
MILLSIVQHGTTFRGVLCGILLRMIFGTKGSDIICKVTVTRQGNGPSRQILVRATICFVLHTRYFYVRMESIEATIQLHSTSYY